MSFSTLKLIVAISAVTFVQRNPAEAQKPKLVPATVSVVSDAGMPKTIVKQAATWNFGPGALQTYQGWQYAAFWDSNCQVSVARRKLPGSDWECVSLGGYKRTSDTNRGNAGPKARGFGDGHEKVAMGISTDGVIHLAFDHHGSTLHYRRSHSGVANRPEQFDWTQTLFHPVQDQLGGPTIESVTYPNFVRDGNRMSLYVRLNGGSGSADSHFFEYESGRWVVNTPETSKLIDKHWSGGNGTVNAYPHSLVVHQRRRHLTWCWRDTPDARTCHDLCYAFSDDHGLTWKNSLGDVVAKRGSQFITADTPRISVLNIPAGSSFVNGGSMVVKDTGEVQVLMKGPDNRPMMARRSALDGTWQQSTLSMNGLLVTAKSRTLVVAASGLYLVSDDTTAAVSYIGSSIEKLSQDSRYRVDPSRYQHDQVISVIGQSGTRVSVIDFLIDK